MTAKSNDPHKLTTNRKFYTKMMQTLKNMTSAEKKTIREKVNRAEEIRRRGVQ